MSLGESARRTIADELSAAPRGSRTDTARRLAGTFGVSVKTVYAVAKVGGAKRPKPLKHPEYREWVPLAVRYAATSPKPLAMDVALRACIESGLLPPEAARMPVATARRIAREMGLAPVEKRTHRMHADYPMQALQIDGSTSEHLTVAGDLGGGDYLLKLHRKPYPASGYKNKPLGPDRLRLLVYGVWDMCTGYTLSRYSVGRGENALGAMEFLCWALAEKEDRRIVMHGLPDDLWSDQGPLVKSGPARDLLERLDVNTVTGEPYAKERMGGVERANRTRWSRFERPLFLRGTDGITLNELNERLAEFEIRENGLRPSRTPVEGDRRASRTQAWTALTNARPADNRLRKLPADPVETMAREARRKIDRNGIVSWGGVEYECADWHSKWVVARRSMDGAGDLVLEDEATGERRPAVRYEPRPYGAVRAVPATPRDRLLAEEPDLPAADIYAPRDDKVVPFPGRSEPAAGLDNPLDADRYRSVEEAMLAFGRLYPHALSPANRAAVAARIEEAGLSRPAVEALALDLVRLASGE